VRFAKNQRHRKGAHKSAKLVAMSTIRQGASQPRLYGVWEPSARRIFPNAREQLREVISAPATDVYLPGVEDFVFWLVWDQCWLVLGRFWAGFGWFLTGFGQIWAGFGPESKISDPRGGYT
jgi:hypothetical protein